MHKPKFKILSIDGGGIRGIIPCTILAFIESQVGPIYETFDLVAGTSTGGIIGLGLCTTKPTQNCPYSAEEMLDLYVKNGGAIFDQRKSAWLSNLVGKINPPISDIISKPYPVKTIEKLLKQYFGDSRLDDTLSEVLITTYDLKKRKPFYFSSRLAKSDPNENRLIYEVTRSTSAAPTFFEPNFFKYKKDEELAAVDGGVFANNPAILAYAEAKEWWKLGTFKGFEPSVQPTDNDLPFYMLSIGTGYSQKTVNINNIANWKAAQWIELLLKDVFMQGVAESTHFTMQHLLPAYQDGTPRYSRLDVELSENGTEMDNASPQNIEQLQDAAQKYVKTNRSKLLEICKILQ